MADAGELPMAGQETVGPETVRPEAADHRKPDERLADHQAIGRLSEDLLPALVAKLGASGLAEIEIREGKWKVRLRLSASTAEANPGRRATDRPSRPQPGHSGHGHAPAAVEGHRSASARDGLAGLTPVGPGRPGQADGHGPGEDRRRAVATSPAVGIFQPRPDMRPGTRIRAGDRLGFVDVLGVRQEVASPVDGLVGATLVAAGDAVEYGQELIVIELPSAPSVPATDGQA